jgi:UDP-glucose 4-epimerase
MRILVTGGAGFIGSHICELLNNKKDIKKILIIDNFKDGSLKNLKNIKLSKKIVIKKTDILNKKKLEKFFSKIDIVIHLAAISDVVPSVEKPLEYINNNFLGTINVLQAMKKYGVKKIIYAASSSCYGISKEIPTNEKSKIETRYPYAFSKYLGELAIKHWSLVYNVDYVSLRLFNVYGIRSRTHGAYGAVLGIFLKQKLKNKPFTVVGNGNQKRDFINVRDVAEAFYKAIDKKVRNVTINIGYGKPNSINQLIKIIKGKKILLPKRPGEPYITHANIDKAKKILNWKPIINLHEGIKEVLKNIDYWKDATLWNSTKIKKATKTWFKYIKS